MYKIAFSKQAAKKLKKISANEAEIIINKIKELAKNPFEFPNIKKITNHPGFRLRVGDWRVIYTIENKKLIIIVINIKTRGEAYK
ncbi:MAG: type II toxin-antitoxin system RelE family toxin [Fidelibacterota bacterium]